MLLQFSVKNYKSIKDRAVLSMEAGAKGENQGNCFETGSGDRVLKAAVIFGANAGGKSNIFKALTAALLTIRRSQFSVPGTPVGPLVPFCLSSDTKSAPSEFEFVFEYRGIKYIYGFSATLSEVVEEHLYAYKTLRPSTVFQREGNEYYFPEAIKPKMAPFVERNLPNKLFLSTSVQWNCPYTKEPMEWLMNGIDTYDTRYEHTLMRAAELFDSDSDGSLKLFTERLLKQADINISDFNIKIEEKTLDEIGRGQGSNVLFSGLELDSKINRISCEMYHDVMNGEKTDRYRLDFEDESLGTKNLFMFAPFIKRALDEGLTIFVDEFDSSLHPLLLKYIVTLFLNSRSNPNNAQLVFSSHSMELMDLELFRRDQIYFVDKDRASGASSLYSLDEFSIRPTFSKLRESYLQGRFDAVPKIGGGEEI